MIPLNSTPLLAKLEIADKVVGTALAANAQGEDEIKNTILRYKVTFQLHPKLLDPRPI